MHNINFMNKYFVLINNKKVVIMAEHEGFKIDMLTSVINDAMKTAKEKLLDIKSKKSEEISIGQMFEMQFLMNNLSQLSEMTTAVVSASNASLMSMARAIKN